MLRDGRIWIAVNANGEPVSIIPKMANRHGLVAGATGTGKTVTLKVMAESFSEMGVPVFIADVKGDVAGMMEPGADSEDMQKRIGKFGLAEHGFEYKGCPVTLWDIYGEKGIQLRTTISEMGPLLLARVLDLNDLQSDILSVVFKIADDNGWLLFDTKDLKSLLNYVDDHSNEYQAEYGKISSGSIGVIIRAVVALESQGADIFFGEPALNITDWLAQDMGRGMINILDSSSLINQPRLYSAFLLWMLSELFETLPEVGDLERPKMVFFFDEAHLLFNDAPKALLEKVEQVVKLIRSKGVGVYFCTQNPRDIPDGVLAQLGNKVQHGLRAYTPTDQKAVKAAADSFRTNPDFDTYDTILNLGTGEAVISFLDEKGIPGTAQNCKVLPPRCLMAGISDAARDQNIKGSLLYSKYAVAVDNYSAFELLQRLGFEEEEAKAALAEQEAAEKEAARIAKEEEKEQARLAKEQQKAEERAERERIKAEEKEAREMQKKYEQMEREAARAEEKRQKEILKEYERKEKERQRAIKNITNSVAGSVGREVGRNVGKSFGRVGKNVGGNVGASIARNIFGTLFKY